VRSIAWSNDDPYAQAMGRPEYSGRVRGVRSGVLPTRSTSRSSATPANQDEVSVLRARLAAQEAAQQALGGRKQCSACSTKGGKQCSVCGAGSAIG
jgi:hypothetical protein